MDFCIDKKGSDQISGQVDDSDSDISNIEENAPLVGEPSNSSDTCDFVIDTKGRADESDHEVDISEMSEEESGPDDDDVTFLQQLNKFKNSKMTRSSVDEELQDVYIDCANLSRRSKPEPSKPARTFCKVDEVMEKSVVKPGFEQLEAVPVYQESKRRLKLMRKAEREKTKGEKWFNLPAPEMTEELKRDLQILQMRSVLDPKHFYKKNDLKVLPKYFQVGRVVDNPADFYHSRIPKKQRKRTLVEELMADSEFMKYKKQKYKEIIAEKDKLCYKAHKRANRLKKKK